MVARAARRRGLLQRMVNGSSAGKIEVGGEGRQPMFGYISYTRLILGAATLEGDNSGYSSQSQCFNFTCNCFMDVLMKS